VLSAIKGTESFREKVAAIKGRFPQFAKELNID
jgi:hypothetical protein